MTKSTQDTYCFPNVLSNKFLAPNNGKTPLTKRVFLSNILHKPMTIMTTVWHGFRHFYITQIHTPGFSTFMTIVQPNFLSDFTTGGHGLDAVYQYYQLKHKEDETSGKRMSPPWTPTPKKYNSFELSILPGYSAGSIDYKII